MGQIKVGMRGKNEENSKAGEKGKLEREGHWLWEVEKKVKFVSNSRGRHYVPVGLVLSILIVKNWLLNVPHPSTAHPP